MRPGISKAAVADKDAVEDSQEDGIATFEVGTAEVVDKDAAGKSKSAVVVKDASEDSREDVVATV